MTRLGLSQTFIQPHRPLCLFNTYLTSCFVSSTLCMSVGLLACVRVWNWTCTCIMCGQAFQVHFPWRHLLCVWANQCASVNHIIISVVWIILHPIQDWWKVSIHVLYAHIFYITSSSATFLLVIFFCPAEKWCFHHWMCLYLMSFEECGRLQSVSDFF